MSTTATDRDAIVRVTDLYIGGFNDCDIEQFREAFTEDAWMYLTDAEGTYRKVYLADQFADWTTPPPSEIVGRVLEVTQSGDIASVLLGYDNLTHPDRCWVDILTLLRIDGTWKIVNKAATHASRGGWAAEQPA
jgi:hypothetical protein